MGRAFHAAPPARLLPPLSGPSLLGGHPLLQCGPPCFEQYLARAYTDVTELPEAVGERWVLGQAYARALAPLAPPPLLPRPHVAGRSSLGPSYGGPLAKQVVKDALALLGQYRL